jgi:hypothetical protein
MNTGRIKTDGEKREAEGKKPKANRDIPVSEVMNSSFSEDMADETAAEWSDVRVEA